MKKIQGRIVKKITVGLFVLSLLTLTACNQSDTQQAVTANPESLPITNPVPIVPTPTPTPKPSATPVPSPTPDQTGGLKIIIRQSKNFDSGELAQLEHARSILEKVVNSEEFKQRVLHFTYSGKETFVQNNGLTNQQIYSQIMAGAEQYPKATTGNQTMDLYTELYYQSSNVIGYTDPSVSTIYMNSYFFDDADLSDIAGNMIHEWLHKLGYDHDYNSTARRPYSVPYAIGYIAAELSAKY